MTKPRRPSKGSGAPKASARRTSPSGRASTGAKGRGTSGAARSKPGGSAGKRQGLGGDQVEGRQAVRELLLAGRRKVHEVWILAEQDPSDILEDIVELAGAERVPVRETSRGKFFAEARCEAPQGVLAKAAPLPESLLDDLATARQNGQPPFLIAVDGVTDPGNLGALLRSAECAGATGIVLPRHRAVHVTPTVTKTAAGAVEHLPFAIVGGLPTALQDLRRQGVWVVGLDGDGTTPLWQLPAADGPIALVLGAEGSGLSRLVRQRCDAIASIPLNGSLSSLNVAAAAAVACYEVARSARLGLTLRVVRPIVSSSRRADVLDMINELLSRTLTDFEIMVLAGTAFALLLSAFIGWRIGKRKSRPMLGVMLGMFLAIPGLFAIALIPTKEPAYY